MDLPSFPTSAAVQRKEEDNDGLVKVLEPPPVRCRKISGKNG